MVIGFLFLMYDIGGVGHSISTLLVARAADLKSLT
jgi:hypothetical protein